MREDTSKIFLKIGLLRVILILFQGNFRKFLEKKTVKATDSNAGNKEKPVQKPSPQITSSLDTISYKRFINQLGTDFKDWLARLSKFASNRD